MQYKWTALIISTLGTLMAGIDGRIVVIGLPTIASQLHASAAEVIWITQAYLLASTVGLLFIGRVSDIFGRVKMYNIGFVVFTIGSALSALSLNSEELIGWRILQGVGSAILVTNSAAIVTDATPRQELGTMLGISQTAWRVGSILGLTLSGLILSLVDWRGLFYINVPIGIVGTIWSYRKLKEIAVKDTSKGMDWQGFGVFTVGLTLILLAITYLSYGTSQFVEGFALLFGGIIMIALFVKIESGLASPLLDLRLFKIKPFAAGNLAQLLNALTWGMVILLMAFYLQIGLDYTPLEAGLAILPLEATYISVALLAGRLSDKYGSRVLATLGIAIIALGVVALSTFDSSTKYTEVALILAVIGTGNGLFTAPNTRAVMGSVPENRRGIASAFWNMMFQIGMTASYGAGVLFITFGIPYSEFSLLLQGSLPQSFVSLAKVKFLHGFSIASLLLFVIEVVAIVPSAMRGSNETEMETEPVS